MNKRAVIGAICVISTLFALQWSALTFAEGEDTASSTFSIDVSNAVLQLSVPIDASITLNPTSSAGDFGSTNLNIKVSTNNATGYRLSMSVPTTDLTHSTITGSNAPVISTLTSSAPESTFPANAWGYKVVGDNYNPILTNNTPSSWEADGPTNETTHAMTLAAKVDGTKPAGAYQNTLTFQVVANPNSPKDTIVFNGNGADGGTMVNQQIFQGEATKLSANVYTKTGYAFNGWNTRADGLGNGYGDEDYYTTQVTNTATTVTLYAQWLEDSKRVCTANCDSGNPTYEAGITIQRAYELAYTEHHLGMYEETENGNGIYERVNSWPPDNEPYKNYDVRFAMQDIDLTYNGVKVCDLVTVIGDQYQALDVRDNKLYYISKLADGKCWMTQNLDMDIVSDVNHPYTSNDTDLNAYNVDGYVSGYSQNNGVIYWVPARNTFSISSIDSDGTINDWVWDQNSPYSYDVGDWYYTDEYYSTSGNINADYNYLNVDNDGADGKFSTSPFSGNGAHGHVGNYYNFSTAIASNNSATYDGEDGVSKNSICPSGWKLPGRITYNSNPNLEEYDTTSLRDSYIYTGWYNTDDIVANAPFYGVRGGGIEGGSYTNAKATLVEAGKSGIYWTSTIKGGVVDGVIARYFFFYSGGVNPADNGGRGSRQKALSVRCLAR